MRSFCRIFYLFHLGAALKLRPLPLVFASAIRAGSWYRSSPFCNALTFLDKHQDGQFRQPRWSPTGDDTILQDISSQMTPGRAVHDIIYQDRRMLKIRPLPLKKKKTQTRHQSSPNKVIGNFISPSFFLKSVVSLCQHYILTPSSLSLLFSGQHKMI